MQDVLGKSLAFQNNKLSNKKSSRLLLIVFVVGSSFGYGLIKRPSLTSILVSCWKMFRNLAFRAETFLA